MKMSVHSYHKHAMLTAGLSSVAIISFTSGVMGAFSVSVFSKMNIKQVALALCIAQIAINFLLFHIYNGKNFRMLRIDSSPKLSPPDSPTKEQIEGLRRSQQLGTANDSPNKSDKAK